MFFKPNKKKTIKIMAEEKMKELPRYQILEEYLIERIELGEKERRTHLLDVQKLLVEIKNQIEFFTRQ